MAIPNNVNKAADSTITFAPLLSLVKDSVLTGSLSKFSLPLRAEESEPDERHLPPFSVYPELQYVHFVALEQEEHVEGHSLQEFVCVSA